MYFIHPVIYLPNKYLLITHCMLGTVPGVEDIAVNRTDQNYINELKENLPQNYITSI